MLFATYIDLTKNELRNPLFQNLASDPTGSPNAGEGRFYWNTVSKRLKIFNGTTWDTVGIAGGSVTSFSSGNLSPLFTTNVTDATSTPALSFTLTNAAQNTSLMGPASGGAGAPTYRAIQQADIPNTIPISYWGTATAALNLGGFKITNGADATANTDFVTLQQLNAAIAGQKKTSVRGATLTTLTISARTSTTLTVGGTSLVLDGVTYANGDTILVKDSTTGAGGAGTNDNGKYVVSGVGTSIVLTRSDDMNSAAEIDGQYVVVEDGGQAGTIWLTVSEVTTLGTDAIVWTKVNQATDLIAGAGLASSGLTWSIASTNSGITVGTDDITLALATNSGLEISSGLKIKPDNITSNTLGVTLTSNGVGVKYDSNSFSETAETLTLASGVAGNGLDLISGVLSVKVDTTTIAITSDTLGVVGYTPVASTTVARKFVAAITIGTGAYTQTVTHNFATKDVQVYVYETSTNQLIFTEVTHSTNTNDVVISGTNNTGSSIAARCVVVG